MAEEEPEHALLGASEKGVSERRIELSTPQLGSDERFHTQNGHYYTQTEHIEVNRAELMAYSSNDAAQQGSNAA